ncbi:MAG: type II toxin-antitoxin system HicA family toxin [Phycisphaeraceae bacterium]|nr:type II toxin-antitoxin system HicA family toxin [Phycisphaeraceae bacterium]
MPKPAKTVDAILCRKGFQRHTGDHVYYYLYVDGKKTAVRTKISHGEKEIDDNLLSLMAKQIKLTKKLFGDLIDCPLTHEQYVKQLRSDGHVAHAEPPRNAR